MKESQGDCISGLLWMILAVLMYQTFDGTWVAAFLAFIGLLDILTCCVKSYKEYLVKKAKPVDSSGA